VAVLDEERASVLDELEMNDRIGRSVMEAFTAAGAPSTQQAKLALHVQVCPSFNRADFTPQVL
jgi:protein Shroom